MANEEELTAKLTSATVEGQATLRALHAALKDIRAEYSLLEESIDTFNKKVQEAQEGIRKIHTEVAKTQAAELSKSMGEAIDYATAAVYKRFDTIAAILMGEEPGDNADSLPELVQRLRASAIGAGLARKKQEQDRQDKIPPALRRQA